MQNSNHILDSPIEFLKGVGPQRGEMLRKELGIRHLGDLLSHFPYRYIDSTAINAIGQINSDMEYVQLRGIISNVYEEGTSFKKRLKALLYDQTGRIELLWFQGASWVKSQIIPNKVYSVFGKISFFNGLPTITHPEFELFDPNNKTDNSLQPNYSSTEKLRQRGLNNRSFAKLTEALIEKLLPQDIPEILPLSIVEAYGLCSRYEAYTQIHFPKNQDALQKANHRLKFEELLFAQIKILQLKHSHSKQQGYLLERVGDYFNTFFKNHLPFELTNAQKRCLQEIRIDTKSGLQMNRLLQGDVGSGKTMVAFMSMLLAVGNEFQACLVAPTEILAQQHFQSIKELALPLKIKVAILTGSVKGKERKQILSALSNGDLEIIIGTHALFEDKVIFKNLGMAIIDEQHRFGVTQRAKLWSKNHYPPHILVMTATPIPRTLAMTVYGDLEVSVIDELPPGRKPIHTIHRNESFRPKIMQFIRTEIDKGRQAYIVYPLIEESEKLDYENLTSGYEQVTSWFPYPQYRVAMVHGKQAIDIKENNMQRFVSGHAHILVATTVIEVGVNVPNASVMVIESAEKFGLSQLHQLRGRVGRGSEKSYCILVSGTEISKEARKRMHIMTSTSDGFKIAEEDLKMRGPGDLYGTKQSGAMDFKIADIVNDIEIMQQAKAAAIQILQEDIALNLNKHKLLKIAIRQSSGRNSQRWNNIS